MRPYLVLFVADTLNISSSVSNRSNLFLPGIEINLYLLRFTFYVFVENCMAPQLTQCVIKVSDVRIRQIIINATLNIRGNNNEIFK